MLTPLNNKVLVRILQEEKKQSGLIIVNQQKTIETCIILSLPKEEHELVVGDTILVPADRMAKIEEGHLVDRKDILAVLDD